MALIFFEELTMHFWLILYSTVHDSKSSLKEFLSKKASLIDNLGGAMFSYEKLRDIISAISLFNAKFQSKLQSSVEE